jgi:hypothetical protein
MRSLQAHVSSGERGVHDDPNVNTAYAFTQDQWRPRAGDATQGIDLPETPQQRLGRQRRGREIHKQGVEHKAEEQHQAERSLV